MTGQPLKMLMQKTGADLEAFTPPEKGGRLINETQKLWHYMKVSSSTRLVFIRSRYSHLFKVRETIIARFEHPLGTFDITAIDDDAGEIKNVDRGHIKFTAEVENPSPGTARGEIYPFLRTINGNSFPPSMQMKYPSGFIVPAGSHLDHRKKYIKDEKTVSLYRQIVLDLFEIGLREVVIPEN